MFIAWVIMYIVILLTKEYITINNFLYMLKTLIMHYINKFNYKNVKKLGIIIYNFQFMSSLNVHNKNAFAVKCNSINRKLKTWPLIL